jgi:RNase H-like domain found in reverse transcriptase/Reverse transcriptase (RNA-dependent DNA polymerase)/Integrase zinc binding domain/Integrase core domain/Chromo (CHRromatin Organisation MOdifier) domain/Retroviral aspartyl protease
VIATPVRAILDTGAGPNLIREEVLQEDWERYRVRDEPAYNIVGAGGRRLRQKGVILLHVELGNLRARARFVVVPGLAAECILGCQFINRHVRNILPRERRVTLSNDSVISILHDSGSPPPSADRKSSANVPPPSTKIRISKLTSVPPRAETLVWVQCAAPGLRFLQALSKGNALGVYLASGVAEILPSQPFPVRIINTSERERKLPKGMILGHALPHPTGIVALADEDDRRTPWGDAREEAPYLPNNDPPPLPDRPDVDGELWRSSVDLAHLLPLDREKVFQMLCKHRSMWDGRLGHVHSTSHRIDLIPGAKPVHAQPYRAGPRAREAESAEVQRMLKAGVIEPANSEWASPVVLVPKPDGSMRFCIDYRRLNALTVRDSYPLPRMDECIDSLGEARVFSTLDCNSGYWQIPVDPADRAKTTFTSHEGLYWFLRMPFGLRNAPATFQRFVDITLAGLTWKTCLVYLDDIIIFSKTKEEHLDHLDAVLQRLYSAGLSLNLKKCYFFKETVSYLGHVIHPGKLSVAEKNTHALRTAKPPTTQSELRSFLGLCNVYRRFVAGFAKIASPLNALLRKGEGPQLGVLSPDQLTAFETLRARLLDPPILALPRADGVFTLDTDASNEQIGCCLYQDQPDGTKHPIGYWSRGLASAERNYSTTEKECLAIVWAVLQLRPYLEGKRFVIRTDHHSLRWVLNLSDAQGRLARWRLRLLEFDFEVQYSPGRAHYGADTMSRLQSTDEEISIATKSVDTDIPCFTLEKEREPSIFQVEDVRRLQEEDTASRHLTRHVGADPTVDHDNFGLVGRLLPSGEFQLSLPPPLLALTPISIVETALDPDAPSCDVLEDASHLSKGEATDIQDTFSRFDASTVEEVLPQTLQLEEIIREQASDPDCKTFALSTGRDSLFDYNESGLLVRKAPLDGVEQIVIPVSLQPRLLHVEHFPRTAGHPGVSRMFRSLRRRYFWRNMSTDISETVRRCVTCAKNRISERKRTSFLKLFPASEPLEYVSLDILGPLPKTEHGNRFLLVITDRFSKLTRTVPLRTITAFVVAKAFCEHWVFAYGPPRHALTDNGTQFTAKFFLAVCRELGIAKVFTTAYHPQTNGQVERYNRTIVNALRGYVSERQNDWDEYTSALTFGYNCRIHASLGLAPFELVLSRPPPPLSIEIPEKGTHDTPETAKFRFLWRIRNLNLLARRRLADSQARYKKNYDHHVREKNKNVQVGSWVYLRREVHTAGVNPKLDAQVDGPFQVLESAGRTFVLQQGEGQVRVSSDRLTPAPSPETMDTGDQRHSHSGNSEANPSDNAETQSEAVDTDDDKEYVFERIIGARNQNDGTLRYRVRWYGYGREADTWEPSNHLPKDALQRYHQRTGLPYPQ